MFPIFIPGTPIPQGSKNVTKTGIMYETNKNLYPWRKQIRDEIQKQLPDEWYPLDGALKITVTFYMPKPKRPLSPHPATKPDLDKLLRSLGDGMTDAGLIHDDARITTWHARKRYAKTKPGALIHNIEGDNT